MGIKTKEVLRIVVQIIISIASAFGVVGLG